MPRSDKPNIPQKGDTNDSTDSASSPLHVTEDESDLESDEEAVEKKAPLLAFGGMTPQEAGRRRWEVQREKEAAGEGSSETLTVTTPIRVGKIIAGLESKAVKGETQAARELRSWLSEYPPQGEADIDPASVPLLQRRRLLARLIAEDNAANEAIA